MGAELTRPVDDGAADRLVGVGLPSVELPAAIGDGARLDRFDTPWLVLYVYPRTGGPGVDLPDDWDLIPGARGCTPQSCAFRDHHTELRGPGGSDGMKRRRAHYWAVVP